MSLFMQIYDAYRRLIALAATIAGLSAFALMWLVDINVITRRLYNAPIPGSVEISQALLVLTIMLGLAFAQSTGAHLRVTIITDRLPRRLRRQLFALAALIGFGFFAVLTLSTYYFALRSFNVNEYAWGAGFSLPLYPVKAAICAGSLLLSVQFLLDAIRVGVFDLVVEHDAVDSTTEPAHV